MKLFCYDSVVRTNLTYLSKKLGIDFLVDDHSKASFFIVLTDGTPDDLCFGLISSYFKDEKHGIITKSKTHRYDAIDGILEYIKKGVNIVYLIIDQEDDSIEYLFNRVHTKLREKGLTEEHIEMDNKVGFYSCSIGPYNYQVILVVNGLTEIDTKKHCIEDHFIKCADVSPEELSKDAWNKLTPEEQIEIYKMLLKDDNLRNFFPQHVLAIESRIIE